MAQHVTAQHLTRLACLYVRQSTLQQVLENTESTLRQYGLLGPPTKFTTLSPKNAAESCPLNRFSSLFRGISFH